MSDPGTPPNRQVEIANNALEAAEEIQDKSIQDLALAYAPGAVETLGEFSKGNKVQSVKPSASVVARAAKSILEFAGGRPETRDPRVGDGAQDLVVTLVRKTDGTIVKLLYEEDLLKPKLDDPIDVTAIADAGMIISSKLPKKASQPQPLKIRKKKFIMPEPSADDLVFEE